MHVLPTVSAGLVGCVGVSSRDSLAISTVGPTGPVGDCSLRLLGDQPRDLERPTDSANPSFSEEAPSSIVRTGKMNRVDECEVSEPRGVRLQVERSTVVVRGISVAICTEKVSDGLKLSRGKRIGVPDHVTRDDRQAGQPSPCRRGERNHRMGVANIGGSLRSCDGFRHACVGLNRKGRGRFDR
jgi:hypothetical protein